MANKITTLFSCEYFWSTDLFLRPYLIELLSVNAPTFNWRKHVEILKLTIKKAGRQQWGGGKRSYLSVCYIPCSSETMCFVWGAVYQAFGNVNLRAVAVPIRMLAVDVLQQGKDLPLTLTQRCQLWGVYSPRTGKFLYYFLSLSAA